MPRSASSRVWPVRLSGTVYCHKGEFGPSAPLRQRWMVAGWTLKVLATIADGPAFTDQRDDQSFLIGTKLLRSSERHSAPFCGLASLISSVSDKGPFELGDAGEHG